jgi:hypothetical protein
VAPWVRRNRDEHLKEVTMTKLFASISVLCFGSARGLTNAPLGSEDVEVEPDILYDP